jgi:disulfide bond formation protein DsbB
MKYLAKLNMLYLTWIIALVGTVSSLYFQYGLGFTPCEFCWYQRIALYPLVAIIPVAILRKDTNIHQYILPFSLAGLALGIYHNLLYYGIIPEKLAPCANGVSCTSRFINLFGFLDIPQLALGGSITITLLMIIYLRSKN